MKMESNLVNLSLEEKFEVSSAKPMSQEKQRRMEILLKNSFFKEKYRKGLKTLTRMDMQELRKEHPEWGLKDMLAAIVKDYHPELPPLLLLEMTQFIIAEWESTQLNKREKPEPGPVPV